MAAAIFSENLMKKGLQKDTAIISANCTNAVPWKGVTIVEVG